MDEVPAGVHQPRNADISVRPQTEICKRGRDGGIQQFPRSQPSAQVNATCTSDNDRVEHPTLWLPYKRCEQQESDGSNRGPDVVHRQKRCVVHRCCDLPGSILRNVPDWAQWLKRQYPQDLGQGHGARYARVGATSLRWWPSMAWCLETSQRLAKCSGGFGTSVDSHRTRSACAAARPGSDRSTSHSACAGGCHPCNMPIPWSYQVSKSCKKIHCVHLK
jgi:hypothetical protein